MINEENHKDYIGKEVLVRFDDDGKWGRRILVSYIQNCLTPFICVDGGYDKFDYNHNTFEVAKWKEAKPIPQEKKLERIDEEKWNGYAASANEQLLKDKLNEVIDFVKDLKGEGE